MVRVVVPPRGIVGDVVTSRVKFAVVTDNPLVVVPLPDRTHKGQIVGSNSFADRAFESANHRPKQAGPQTTRRDLWDRLRGR